MAVGRIIESITSVAILWFDCIYFEQCDQIAILFVQYLTINSNENMPNGIEKLRKYAKNNAKY